MKCPKCSSEELKVNEKRDLEAEATIRRRRECLKCGYRFTTYERIETPSLLIIKKNGDRELYNREKLAGGIYKAFEKRPHTPDQIEKIIDEIEHEINQSKNGEVKSTQVGDLVITKLKEADNVAYLRFASVYKAFSDAESFTKEAESLKK